MAVNAEAHQARSGKGERNVPVSRRRVSRFALRNLDLNVVFGLGGRLASAHLEERTEVAFDTHAATSQREVLDEAA